MVTAIFVVVIMMFFGLIVWEFDKTSAHSDEALFMCLGFAAMIALCGLGIIAINGGLNFPEFMRN